MILAHSRGLQNHRAKPLRRGRDDAGGAAGRASRNGRQHSRRSEASDASYRQAAVREEDLWRVVEDPRARSGDARAAARSCWRGLDEPGKARVRVAAERATASPKLRVALEAATAEDRQRRSGRSTISRSVLFGRAHPETADAPGARREQRVGEGTRRTRS